jgi:hypothetical protein
MTKTLVVLGLLLAGCSNDSGAGGCVAAGGECVLGGYACPNPDHGPQECNPDRNPGGAFCCLPCPKGETLNDAGTTCE